MIKLITVSVLTIIILGLLCYYRYQERIGNAKHSNIIYATIWGLIIILVALITELPNFE